MAVRGGGFLALAIIAFFISAGWWVFSILSLTPGRLALLSLFVGLFPLLLTFIGVGLAKISGGQVDGRGATDCYLLGLNLNNLVATLFMCHWAVFFTGGFAVLGLMASGLWALFR